VANEFIIKINTDRNGNEVSLSNMTIDVVEALNNFLVSLKDLAKLHNNENFKFTLKDGCIEAGIEYPETDVEIDKEIEELLEGKSENNNTIKIFKAIQDKVKLNGLDYTVLHTVKGVKKNVTEVFKSKNFAYKRGPRKEWNEEVVFIEGEIFDAGGKVKANLHIQTTGKEEFKLDCTKEQAGEIRLYNKIFVSAVKKWKDEGKPLYTFIDNYLTQEKFTHYKEFYNKIDSDSTLSKYDVVHNEIVRILNDDTINNGEILKLMRLYNFEFSDRGIIRTILMTLKPVFSDNKKLHNIYNELADTLRAGSKNNII
jgi:hypothetical protein